MYCSPIFSLIIILFSNRLCTVYLPYTLNNIQVVIVSNDRDLTITNQPLDGEQMGEYYGFSLLAANLAGDT